MNDIQAWIDGLSAQWQRERSESQMTLGKLITRLEGMPSDAPVEIFGEPHSYRGYYEDLAFERGPGGFMPASVALSMCRAAMGRTFQGYKGGEYQMGEKTPVWMAYWGDCGQKIMALNEEGMFELAEDE